MENQLLSGEVFVGLDTHRETVHSTAIAKDGSVICSTNFPNSKEGLDKFFEGFNQWNTTIALEACNFWRGCFKIIREKGYKIKLANPLKCRQVSKDKKTDKKDSEILADLLRVNYLPEVYIPSDEILALRDLTRNKISLTRLKVKIQNKIKAYLSRNGIPYQKKIWNDKGIKWLRDLKNFEINTHLKVYEVIKREQEAVMKKIEKIARNKEEAILLKTIPGIGDFGATLIFAEIGDIGRFPDPKHLHAYSGVCPGIYQSGTQTRPSSKKEVNYWLKWITIECAGRVTLTKCKLQKYYFKMKAKKGWKIARKATARKMLTIAWYVLKEKVPYHES